MFQKTYQVNSVEEISGIAAEIRNMSLYRSASCRVLLAWAQLWDSDGFAAFRQEIVDRFCDFTVIGANSHSREEIQNNILDGSGDEKGCLLTFLFFENSAVSLYGIRTGYREVFNKLSKYKSPKSMLYIWEAVSFFKDGPRVLFNALKCRLK